MKFEISGKHQTSVNKMNSYLPIIICFYYFLKSFSLLQMKTNVIRFDFIPWLIFL